MTPEWDKTTDVVVVGYGGAGATAAIAAHDAGAEVLVLESTDQGGGNTLVSFGGFLCPDHAGKAHAYLSSLYDFSRSERDDRLIQVFVEESMRTTDWLKGLGNGIEVQKYGSPSYPEIAGADAIRKYVVKGTNKGGTAFARNLWQLLSSSVQEKRTIPVLTRTPVERLVTDNDGEVIGVIARSEEKEVAIRACRGVILTTGGYEFDPVALQNHVKGYPIHSLGHPGNRGDGLRMAQKVGAKLWHMNGVSCAFGIKVPEFASALPMAIGNAGQIFVDKAGKRFVDEGAIEGHAGLLAVDFFDSHSLSYPRIPFFLIFDESTRQKGPVSRIGGVGSAGVQYEWSRDNLAEVDKGWIRKGETVAGLARKLDLDETSLGETIARWNADVRGGVDTLFHRGIPENRSSALVENGPFYAVEIHPSLANTQGGPRRNEKAEVLDAFDVPIPRLYSAGELGSMWGLIYQGGGNIAECMAFGRIAGANAARENPSM
jgi:succinate dehydrogenase/fumarate reductase flavoprotein subunit